MTLSIHRYHAKVCRRLQLVMPTGADPISYIAVATRPRMRLSVKKDARGLPMLQAVPEIRRSAGEGPAVSLSAISESVVGESTPNAEPGSMVFH